MWGPKHGGFSPAGGTADDRVSQAPIGGSVRVVSVVGARPQFVKLAPIAREFEARGFEHLVVHTGQHYDATMSEALFADFTLAPAEYNLGIGSGSQAEQTARMMVALEPLLADIRSDWVLAYGDTNSTLAAALAAAKLRVPIAHVEAGLRSFNRDMPEEINRIVTDHTADLLLAPTATAVEHLHREGLAEATVLVGDVMADICMSVADQVRLAPPVGLTPPTGDFVVATIHRPYNTDDPHRLDSVLSALAECPIPVLPAHPRLVGKARSAELPLERGSITSIPPLTYSQMVFLLSRARAVATDSGGLQKEAYLMGAPCTTIRSETEWVETVATGWNVLCFDDLESLVTTILRPVPTGERPALYGNGDAASRIAEALIT